MEHSQQKSELIMKNYEINNQANKIQANLSIEKKNFMDFYKEVKNGKIVPVTDEQDNIIGFNVIKNEPSMMKVCKIINGYMTVGDTEEQRSEDEVNLRKFIKEYPSAKQAGKELGIGNTGITSCCTGHRKSCGGYIWKYKEK